MNFDELHRQLTEMQAAVSDRLVAMGAIPAETDTHRHQFHLMISVTPGKIDYTLHCLWAPGGSKIEDASHPGELLDEYERRLRWATRQQKLIEVPAQLVAIGPPTDKPVAGVDTDDPVF